MPSKRFEGPLERVNDCLWRIPKTYKAGMRVDGLIYADDALISLIREDQAAEQVANVAFLPGIQHASLAMPDIHWGYGFCIGGVCATDPEEGGVISPGGVGYDINCGVRLVRSELTFCRRQAGTRNARPGAFPQCADRCGARRQIQIRAQGAQTNSWHKARSFCLPRGLATESDIEHTEARGCLAGARPDFVSDRALDRGYDQCGSLGSGNHFLEVQVVDRVFDEAAARALGLAKDGVCVMIHSGSRGLGYQVCDDALRALRGVPEKYGIELPDRQLACAPVHSPEGQHYLGGMRAAANFAWGNRQLLMWQAREVFERIFGRTWEDLGMHLIYDVAHNIAKFEEHDVGGVAKRVWVHRKGATRAFPPESPGGSRPIPTDRPARPHSRRHGPGKLGAVGPTGKHGTDLRQRLPRRGAALEPHGSHEARARSQDRARASQPRRDCASAILAGLGRGTA